MTTPGGVPNLPEGALTLDNIASKTQDMTPSGMRGRTNERVSSIFGSSTGGDITSDLSPFGIIAAIFAGFSSVVANSDPADIQGPQDLPGLLIDFIESLPFVGQFVELFEAILGNYTGTDTTLLAIQSLFAPIRAVVDAFTALVPGGNFLGFLSPSSSGSGIFAPLINGILGGTGNPLSSLFSNLLGTASTASTANTNANTGLSNWSSLLGGLPGVSSISSLLSFLNPASSSNGIFAPLINLVTGGTTNPLSTLGTSLTTTASTTSTNSTNITSLISNLFGGSSILSQVQPGAIGGVTPGANLLTDVGDVLKNLFNGITRTSATAATQADAAVAVASQSDAVVGQASAIQQIRAALGQGNPDADDFERTSTTTIGANWSVTQTGTGVLATPNGHDASFTGTGAVEFVARKTDKTAATLHQTSSIVLATAIPSYPFFTPLPYGGNIDLWVLMTAFTTFATRTGLRFRVNSAAPYAATWFIHWVNAGTETQLATGSLSIPAAGGALDWEVGIGGNLKAYQARLNGTGITGTNFTDSVQRGTVGTNIYRGFGGKGTTGFGLPQGVPSLKVWTAEG